MRGWRQRSGKLWQINQTVRVTCPGCVLMSVGSSPPPISKLDSGGSLTDLTLVGPNAYNLLPEIPAPNAAGKFAVTTGAKMIDAINKLIEGLRARVQLMVGRAILTAINDATRVQTVQAQLLDEETHDEVERIQHYGYTSVPLPGRGRAGVCGRQSRPRPGHRHRRPPLPQGKCHNRARSPCTPTQAKACT